MDVRHITEREKGKCRAETEDGRGSHSRCEDGQQIAMVRTCSTEGRERLRESYVDYPVMDTCQSSHAG